MPAVIIDVELKASVFISKPSQENCEHSPITASIQTPMGQISGSTLNVSFLE